jgi:translation initiation factor eIF-2B subunit beta
MAKESSLEELNSVLNTIPSVRSEYQSMMLRLKRRQLIGSQICARETLELVRLLIARYNFSSTDHMMRVVRTIGRELTNAAQTELTIGNVVRRVLFLIRDEHANQMNLTPEEMRARSSSKDAGSFKGGAKRRDRAGSDISANSVSSTTATAVTAATAQTLVTASTATLYSNPMSTSEVIQSLLPMQPVMRSSASFDSMIGAGLSSDSPNGTDPASHSFTRHFPSLKAAVLGAINELSAEVDNHAAIVQRAGDYIHQDECILTFGYSRVVELFLKAAGAKRRFQLIIAEAAPALDGHRLALSLSKVSNIAVTLMPDSGLYAIMGRVNKVLLGVTAVMADGGAIVPSGQLMVATAAKEFSVPVVCAAASFALTPLFAHSLQTAALQQLLSPSAALPYNAADINFANVVVCHPAFDHLPPDLVSIYVSSDGSQLPSYVFRQLSEYYHPKDHVL